MKRDQCNLSAQRISVHDAQQLARFRAELQLQARLEREGHSRQCALFQVFEDGAPRGCTCGAQKP